MITRTDIQDAAQRIATHVRHTPIIELEKDALDIDAKIFFKLECLQHAGSFKPRGAFNSILSSQIPEAGVIAASGGNHGAAVAYAAQKLGHRAEIFVPDPTPANNTVTTLEDTLGWGDIYVTTTGNVDIIKLEPS